jgi:tetratricopeptide (TPR) repeat protein
MAYAMRCAVVVVTLAWAVSAPAAVVFELAGNEVSSAASAVSVVGAFNAWNAEATPMKREGSFWRVSVALPDGLQVYKFVWKDAAGQSHGMNDPANPYLCDDGQKAANNVLNVQAGARVAMPATGWERFEWEAPTAKWVSLAGDFNEWRMGQFSLVRDRSIPLTGKWLAYLPLKRPFAYKFIIDDIWKTDLPGRAQLISNGLNGFNSFRPAESLTSPSLITITRSVAAGDTRELDAVTSYANSGDYGHAVALARKIAQVNSAASGSTSPLVLRALDAEAAVHKRWNRLDDAAACWQRVVDSNVKTTDTFKATAELAAYYLYSKRDSVRSQQLLRASLALAPDKIELVRTMNHWLMLYQREARVQDALDIVNELLAQLPEPDESDKAYAAELTELYIIKAGCLNRLRRFTEAIQTFRRVIEIHPWKDSQNVQEAQRWIKILENRDPRIPGS